MIELCLPATAAVCLERKCLLLFISEAVNCIGRWRCSSPYCLALAIQLTLGFRLLVHTTTLAIMAYLYGNAYGTTAYLLPKGLPFITGRKGKIPRFRKNRTNLLEDISFIFPLIIIIIIMRQNRT